MGSAEKLTIKSIRKKETEKLKGSIDNCITKKKKKVHVIENNRFDDTFRHTSTTVWWYTYKNQIE